MIGWILGGAGALLCAMLFFMLTAFGGGGLVAPGRPALARAVQRYITFSLFAGPILCGLLGLLAWLAGLPWLFAGPPVLVAAQVVVIFRLYGKR